VSEELALKVSHLVFMKSMTTEQSISHYSRRDMADYACRPLHSGTVEGLDVMIMAGIQPALWTAILRKYSRETMDATPSVESKATFSFNRFMNIIRILSVDSRSKIPNAIR
jgi:hypothetical protein